MVLLVDVADSRWIADVGFGAEGLLEPVPFGSGVPAPQHRWCYRVIPQGDFWIMQSLRGEAWGDLYAFTLEPQHPIDFEVANHYTSTHPDSRFVQMLIAQRPLPDHRVILRNRELTVDRGDTADRRVIASDEELLAVLAGEFDLHLPPGTRFGVLAAPPALR
jgi:N-hydroxyarylamine O-acetyltransferase